MNFTAIDFETANPKRNSACAIGLVRVEGGQIVKECSLLIRPPSRWFKFTYIHSITWDDVRDKPTFKEIWPEIAPFILAGDFLVAHNAPFDHSVLKSTCHHYGIPLPELKFKCTVRLARYGLGIRPAKLSNVCRVLGIPLENHHDALCDAKACAQIMLRAQALEEQPLLWQKGC